MDTKIQSSSSLDECFSKNKVVQVDEIETLTTELRLSLKILKCHWSSLACYGVEILKNLNRHLTEVLQFGIGRLLLVFKSIVGLVHQMSTQFIIDIVHEVSLELLIVGEGEAVRLLIGLLNELILKLRSHDLSLSLEFYHLV